MKLKQNDSYLIGSAAKYKTVYVPFDNGEDGWQPGKRYIYTSVADMTTKVSRCFRQLRLMRQRRIG